MNRASDSPALISLSGTSREKLHSALIVYLDGSCVATRVAERGIRRLRDLSIRQKT